MLAMRYLLPLLSFSAVTCVYLLTSLALFTDLEQHTAADSQTSSMAAAPLASRMPALYLAHGGGPFPVLGEPGHAGLAKFMAKWPTTIPKPAALLIVSAHWEVGNQ